MLDDVDGHGEDDGGVVLGGDGGEGLQVPEVAVVNIVLMVVVLRWHVNMVERSPLSRSSCQCHDYHHRRLTQY